MPSRIAVWRWDEENRKENPNDPAETGFHNLYARAKELWCEAQAEKCLNIADNCDVDNKAGVLKAANQVKARQWLMERRSAAFHPKTDNKHEHSGSVEEVRRIIIGRGGSSSD